MKTIRGLPDWAESINVASCVLSPNSARKIVLKVVINILKKVRMITKTPIVVIGGINFNNYKNLLLNKANFLAISGYIWKNKKLKPKNAIKKLI